MNLAKDLGGDGRVEVDGVVPQALGGLVAFATATLEGFPHTNLCAVAVLGVVFDTVHILKNEVACRNTEEKWRRATITTFDYTQHASIKHHSIIPDFMDRIPMKIHFTIHILHPNLFFFKYMSQQSSLSELTLTHHHFGSIWDG